MWAIGLPLLFFRSIWHILKIMFEHKIRQNWIELADFNLYTVFLAVIFLCFAFQHRIATAAAMNWISRFCNRFFRSNIFNWIFLSCNDSKWTVRIQIILPKFEITANLFTKTNFSWILESSFYLTQVRTKYNVRTIWWEWTSSYRKIILIHPMYI